MISSTVIIPLSFYRPMAPRTMFIRTMLNVAALVGESFTTYTCDEKVTAEYRETAKLIPKGTMTPAEIEEMVTTPGCTTIEDIYEIEDGKLRTALMNAVEAATNKSVNIRYKWENGG